MKLTPAQAKAVVQMHTVVSRAVRSPVFYLGADAFKEQLRDMIALANIDLSKHVVSIQVVPSRVYPEGARAVGPDVPEADAWSVYLRKADDSLEWSCDCSILGTLPASRHAAHQQALIAAAVLSQGYGVPIEQ
jgi:hypothetical protein